MPEYENMLEGFEPDDFLTPEELGIDEFLTPEESFVTNERMMSALESTVQVLRTEYLGLIGIARDLLDEINGEFI